MGLVVIVAVFVGIVVLIILGARWANAAIVRRRAQAIAGPAAQLGLMPVETLPEDLPPFELLNTGSNRTSTNILRGSVRGTDVVLFDYSFLDKRMMGFTGLHYHDQFATTTIACARGSWLQLPAFAIEPDMSRVVKEVEAQVAQQVGDGAMGKVAHALMTLAEGMTFNQPGWRFSDRPDVRYVVRNGDEAAVRAAFTPGVLDFLRDHHGWIVEGRGSWVMVTFSWQFRAPALDLKQQRFDRGILPPEQLGALVGAATDTVEAFRSSRT